MFLHYRLHNFQSDIHPQVHVIQFPASAMDIEDSLTGGLASLIKTDVDPKAKAQVLASKRVQC